MTPTHPSRRSLVGMATVAALLLGGCAVSAVSTQPLRLRAQDTLAVLPFSNLTDVPQAQLRAQAIAVSLLRQRGLRKVVVYPQPGAGDLLQAPVEPSAAQQLRWARRQGATYALGGNVTEWRYKTGVDNEPAVGVTLQLRRVADGSVAWSASGGRSGWGYQGLAAVGQQQIAALLSGLQVVAGPKPAQR